MKICADLTGREEKLICKKSISVKQILFFPMENGFKQILLTGGVAAAQEKLMKNIKKGEIKI